MVKITLAVEGMMCNKCEKHVNEAIKENFNVKKVTADHEVNSVEIIAAEEPDMEKVKAAVVEAGYTAGEYTVENIEKKGLFF